jgi:hypothetical protein
MKVLSPKHKLFADLYSKTGNAAGSYRNVYECSPKAAKSAAYKVLKRADVIAYLEQKEVAKANLAAVADILDADEAMREETVIVRQTLSDILDENGEIKDLKDWPERVRKYIKEVDFAHMPMGSDGHGNPISERYIKKIHFYDKGQALGRVEKVLGMNAPEKKLIGVQLTIREILQEIDGQNRGKLPQDCK